ncbi:MAG: metallophosphoesterase [Clostridia bacterium]|nr:metallophosphoesterase [Clostridia bacterium]
MKREINHVTVRSARIETPLTLALVADLHDGPFDDLTPELCKCDAILIVGDLVERHHGLYRNAIRFVEAAPEIAPTFYAIGNHERKLKALADYWPHVERSRVTVLDDRFVSFKGITLGGLTSRAPGEVRAEFLGSMEKQSGFRLLMCHHPEYYQKYIAGCDIDLTVSGHAHGGQVRIGSQGLYAPGQWWLPKLTSGFYFDGRLFVSRGLTNATWAPRINCNCELVVLHLEKA